jgi:hypothetical protein
MTLEEEEDDSEDDDAGSWYDTVNFLTHIPDVRSLQGLVSGGSTSQASRAASAPIKGEKERAGGPVRGPRIGGPLSRGLPRRCWPHQGRVPSHRSAHR